MKKMKKIAGVVLAVAMVFCLSIGAFAATDTDTTTQTVTIKLQTVDRTVNPMAESDLGTVTVPNMATTATLKDVIDAAVADTTNLLTAVTWEEVDILDTTTWLPTGEKGWVLQSLTYNGTTYENEVITSTNHYYEGIAWSYFYGLGVTPPSQYSDEYVPYYLSQVYVSNLINNGFTLSFEHSDMDF